MRNASAFWNRDAWTELEKLIAERSIEFSEQDKQRLAAVVEDYPPRALFPNFAGTDEEFAEIADSFRLRQAHRLQAADFPISDGVRALLEAQRAELEASEEPAKVRSTRLGWQAPANADELLTKNPNEICEILADGDGIDAGHRLADLIEKDFNLGLRVISMLISEQISSSVWEIGLGALTKESVAPNLESAFDALLSLARDNPNWVRGAGVRALSRFLYSIGEEADALETISEPKFIELWDLAFAGAIANEEPNRVDANDPVEEAINAPGGDLAKALIDLIFARKLEVGAGLPVDLRTRFDRMWNGTLDANQHARTIIASRVQTLHRIDPNWAADNILSAMCEDSEGALSLWVAMLWPAQWDIELVYALQPGFQVIFRRMHGGPETFPERLSEWIASILVFAPDTLTDDTITSFFLFANSTELGSVAWLFRQTLEDAGEKAPELWASKIKRVFDNFWPANIAKKSSALSNCLLALSLTTREAFDDVINSLCEKGLIIETPDGHWLDDCIVEADEDNAYDYAGNHPTALLRALTAAINETLSPWNRGYLSTVLDRICAAAPDLENDPRFRRLRAISIQG